MKIYTKSQADAPDGTERVPDPPPRQRRFDERGIALQTVIIMVVMLAIAGAIAAVLLSRGGEAANQLEAADTGVAAASFNNATLCRGAGHGWNGSCASLAEVNGNTSVTKNANSCEELNPNWSFNSTDSECEV